LRTDRAFDFDPSPDTIETENGTQAVSERTAIRNARRGVRTANLQVKEKYEVKREK
jgi:hypothetical protein